MHKHRTPEGLEEHALIDRAVLNLMLDLDKQRPWAEDEIARAISFPGDVRDSLRRLRASRLIHRWNDLATASRPAVRYYEITQGSDPDSADERHHDKGPRSEEQIFEAFGARKRKQRIAITDALNRLDEAGLIDRRGGRAIASEVARRLDELMTL